MQNNIVINHNNVWVQENVTYSFVFHGWIERRWKPLRNAPKMLARRAGVSPRCAETWLAGKSAPSGDTLITLMSRCDCLREEIDKLIEARRENRT